MSLLNKIQDAFNPLNYSIHTIELEKKITFGKYERLTKMFFAAATGDKYNTYRIHNKVRFQKYTSKGLDIDLVSKLPSGHYIVLRLNLKEIASGEKTCFGIYKLGKDSLDNMDYNLRKMMSFLGSSHTIDTFLLSRVDFCVNAQCNDNREVKTYIALARKGHYPYGYKDLFPRAAKREGKKKIVYCRSFDLINENRGYEISLYNKYEQLLDIKVPEEKAKYSKGILRFEVRCYKREINSLLGAYEPVYYGIDTINYLLQTAQYRLQEEIKLLFTPGRYFDYQTALDIITASDFKPQAKEHMLFWVYAASYHQRSSIGWKLTIDKFNLNADQKRKLKRNMKQLDLNPVTIGKRSPFQSLQSIPELFYVSNS